jgi:uncharacterized cupredoxin-like copper-binding protein
MMGRMAMTLAVAAFSMAVADAPAHGEGKHAGAAKKVISSEHHPWGREGDPAKASRTVLVKMADTMRYTPSRVEVRRGDTVKFVVTNAGKTMHEMVIGTEAELKAHAEVMKKHPGMEHDAPYMAHVPPGQKETITWTFDQPGTFMYGCLIPGHWEAGMKGTIVVRN